MCPTKRLAGQEPGGPSLGQLLLQPLPHFRGRQRCQLERLPEIDPARLGTRFLLSPCFLGFAQALEMGVLVVSASQQVGLAGDALGLAPQSISE